MTQTSTDGHGADRLTLYYSPAYAMAGTEFDTTRKAAWVAESLEQRPIDGVRLVAPTALGEEAIAQVHHPEYVRAVRTGEPGGLARSNGIGWDPDLFEAVAASNGGAVAAALDALTHGTTAGSLSSGLHHAKARAGELSGFTGIDDPYEEPLAPEARIGEGEPLDESIDLVMDLVAWFAEAEPE